MAGQCDILLEDYTEENYIRNAPLISFRNDLVKFGEDADEDEFPEIELVEIPVVKRMVFQFKKPVKLEFS